MKAAYDCEVRLYAQAALHPSVPSALPGHRRLALLMGREQHRNEVMIEKNYPPGGSDVHKQSVQLLHQLSLLSRVLSGVEPQRSDLIHTSSCLME